MAIFGYVGLIICPVVYLVTQNSVHRCSRCLALMGVKKCFGLPDDPNQPIWHLKLGKCQIVVARIYVILGLLAFSVFAIYYAVNRPYRVHHSFFDTPEGVESHNITITWNQYLDDCSGEKIIENQVHALHQFTQNYKNNVVNWDGYYIDTKYKAHGSYSLFDSHHHMSILIKMDPSESDNFSDILLTMTQAAYKANKEVLDKLQKGDHLFFKGKLFAMGSEFKLHHLKLVEAADSVTDSGHTKDLDHIEVHDTRIP